MTRDEAFEFCTGLPGSVEDYPFGDGAAVFKVGGKMFALISEGGAEGSMNLKCDPEIAVDLRTRHASVRPGYHMNKQHWNSVDFGGSVDTAEFEWMIEHSYELVVKSLTAAKRAEIQGL